jgi:hypothetical protein
MKCIGFMTLAMMLSACGGSDGIDLRFSADATEQGLASALVIDSDLDVQRLQLQLREVKVLPESGDDDKYKLDGTFTLDLLDASKSTVPAPDLTAAVYKKIEFKIDKPDDGGGLDGTDASLWFEGAKSGAEFRFVAWSPMKITLRDDTGIDLGASPDEDFVVDLRVAEWLTGVDLDALAKDTDGVVVIDQDGANKNAHKTVRDNILEAIKLLRKKR